MNSTSDSWSMDILCLQNISDYPFAQNSREHIYASAIGRIKSRVNRCICIIVKLSIKPLSFLSTYIKLQNNVERMK